MTIWEILRLVILVIGWPILIGGSIFVFIRVHSIYSELKRVEFLKLSYATLSGWIVTMFSLGIAATAYMISNPIEGVIVTLPVFIVWFITMVVLIRIVFKLSTEVKELSTVYERLEKTTEEKEELSRIMEKRKQELAEADNKLSETLGQLERLSGNIGKNREIKELKGKLKKFK